MRARINIVSVFVFIFALTCTLNAGQAQDGMISITTPTRILSITPASTNEAITRWDSVTKRLRTTFG